MKKTDIAMIVLIAGVSVFASYLIMNEMIKPSEKKETVDTMEVISAEYQKPSAEIFNKDAINPTRRVFVGEEKKPEEAKQ